MHHDPGNGRVVAGRYRLIDLLGRGAMGVVWHGRDELLGRDVAIKQVVLPPMASDAEARASYRRTLREARTAAKLNHPGVITIFDVIEEGGMPWIVMELIRARPLDQVIAEDGPLPPAQAAQLGLSLLDALTTAHDAGVLHRDVKPSNVLITPQGQAVLTDFGIATVQGDPGMTQAGMVVGTPGFSPPERVRGDEATPACDLWSLGATLYAAVEGRGPFDRAGGSTAIVASIATEPAPRAPSAGPLAPVIDMLLRSDPAERPDAAATARLLTTAWTDARRLKRFGGALLGPAQPRHPRAEPDPAAEDGGARAAAPPARAALGETTATQVVTIREAAEAPPEAAALARVSLADRQPGTAVRADAAAGSALDAAANSASATGVTGLADVAVAATDVVPDLMATPVFAELRMPADAGSYAEADAGAAAASQPSAPDSAGDGSAGPVAQAAAPSQGNRLSRGWHSRRGLVLAAPVLVSALVAGIVFLAFPGIGNNFGHFFFRQPGGSALNSGLGNGRLSRTAPASRSKGKRQNALPPAGQQPTAAPTPQGKHHPGSPGSPRPSAHPSPSTASPSSQPSPSPSPSQSASASPSPSPSPVTTGGTLPAGYAWRSVSAVTAGTTAGFRLAAPAAWLMAAGLQTYIQPPLGGGRLEVNMAAFAAPGPFKEAKYLQAKAIAHHRYRRYHLVSLLAHRFHDWPAAWWTFWWKPLNRPRRDVTAIIFIAQTAAGPQPYILSMSSPAAQAAYASHVMRIAMRTFSPVI
jgi:eukaryotic-like serine/threonine-protein kinase